MVLYSQKATMRPSYSNEVKETHIWSIWGAVPRQPQLCLPIPECYERVIRSSEVIIDGFAKHPASKYIVEASDDTIEQMAKITPDVLEKLKAQPPPAGFFVFPSNYIAFQRFLLYQGDETGRRMRHGLHWRRKQNRNRRRHRCIRNQNLCSDRRECVRKNKQCAPECSEA